MSKPEKRWPRETDKPNPILAKLRGGTVRKLISPTLVDLRRPPSSAGRFPQPDVAHAKNALGRLSMAEGLTPQQRYTVAQRAANIMGKVTPGAEKYGVRELTASPQAALGARPVVIPGSKTRLFKILPRKKVKLT